MAAARKQAGYAAGTAVSVSKTHDEIRSLLTRYGAEGFMVGEHNIAIILMVLDSVAAAGKEE